MGSHDVNDLAGKAERSVRRQSDTRVLGMDEAAVSRTDAVVT